MATVVFLSAVSDEFHKPDPRDPRRFHSYRIVLANALSALGPDYIVITQEDLAQGFGDLLQTLDEEIQRSGVVVHLIGNLAGCRPETASVRRLQERHGRFLDHEPELGETLIDITEISYTQWEIYLAFEHRRKRLVFLAEPHAPRSPSCSVEPMEATQTAHLARLMKTGEHREPFEDQRDLALRVVTSLVRFGIGPGVEPEMAPEAMASARLGAAALTQQIADAIRKPADAARASLDSSGVDAYLRAVDTAALQRELTRRQALEVVVEYRDELREAVTTDPTEADLRELALAELALGHYSEAMDAARRCATLAEEKMASEPDRADKHRETALNAYLLLRESAEAAGHRDDAISALERGCA